ncbi:SDR family oxidoreductase [Raphidocelis subcapitata]|uniref:SDR family oxidoreductase n=1 Tax=Raphidocelis subcapitata TaxID=307507 RepID=A0A2V0NYV3_9CHLO|nr:SDR family oxidoreductase [Raphidocelis subcapitata]|eukprot:GBF92818.1 SDR family oxidoreductase [Raphidocelis subcapitata]
MAPPRIAVVTGVARRHGIGHAIAALLRETGYRVIGIDRRPAEEGTIWLDAPAPAAAAVAGPRSAAAAGTAAPPPPPPPARLLQLDLSDPAAIAELPRRLGPGPVHLLVCNAGVADPHLPAAPPGAPGRAAAFAEFLQVNLAAPFLLTEALAPLMPAGDAAIVNIASTRARQSEPNCEGYAASKGGLEALTHAQAASLAGVARVNCICPGWIDTSGQPESLRPEDHEWHWTGRVGRPSDVAELAAFLADGSRSGFITGQSFVVDGGVSRRMAYPE